MISFVFGFNFQSKTESLQSNRVVNDLSVNKDFTCNQFVVANGSVYSFQQIKDLLSADGEANLQNSKQHILNFDEDNKLELIFLKDSVVELSAFSQAENIASKMQAERLDDGTVAIQIIDETDIVNISTSQDAQYSLHSLMFSTDATVNFADGQFNVGEKKGPTSFVDAATDIPTAKLVNLTSGSFGLSGTKTYSPKTVTTTAEDGTTSTGPQEGRAVYQGGGTLTISGITLDGFWLNMDEDTMGAAVMSDAGTLNLDCNITNSIAYMGSAVAVMGTCNILGGEYYNNVSWAGGIGTMGGTLNIGGGKFYDNFSQYAGAAFANLQGTMIFENCEVYHNYAQYAAICTMYGTTTINGGKYYNNLGYAGGVSIIADESTMIVNGGEYYGNIAMYVGGVFNACPNTDASPITLTVNGGYYHDNYQTEEMTFELPEHAAKLMGVPEEERVAVLPVTYETQGYLFYLGNSPRESTVIEEKTTTFSLNGGTFSNNIPAGAEKAAEIWIEDYNYISLGMELTSDLHVYKNGLTSFANGDLASSYIISTDNATYLQSAANHIKMIELPEIAVVTTQAKENYLVVERYHSGGLYNEETGALIYTWQQLISNSYVTVSTSSTTQEDGTVVVSNTITAADNANLAGMLVIPEGITGMGAMVIFQNETTTGLYLPKSLTNYLHEVDVENNVTDVSVFLCLLLDNINVHSENPEFTDIDGVLYSKDLTKLIHVPGGKTGTITIADSVTEIVDAGCMAIQATEIVLPSGLLTAGDAAFAYTVMLETMVVPDSVQSFGYGAFMLAGLQAANGTLIDFRSSTDIPSLGEVGLEECPNSVKVWVPTELYYDWVEAENWKDYAHLLYADDVQLVVSAPGVYNYETNELLFSWNDAMSQGLATVTNGELVLNTAITGTGLLYTVVLPDTITSIPSSKWSDSNEIAKLVIPSSVTSIGDQAFAQSQLREVIIKDAYCSIGLAAFGYMLNLTYLDIGKNVTSIGMLAFAATFALTNSVANLSASCSFDPMSIIGSGFAQINVDPNHATYASIDGAVYSKDLSTLYCCPSGYVGEINIPSSVTALGEGAFAYSQYLTGTVDISNVVSLLDTIPDLEIPLFLSSGLTKCILPALLTDIPSQTFSQCSNLQTVENVNNIQTIGSQAFEDCASLITQPWGNSLQTIGNYGFYRCTALDGTLTFPSTLTAIGEEGFQYCSSIDALIFDDCPVNISRYAFEYCSSIQSVDFGSQLRSLGNCVFRGNTTINGTITIPSTCTSIASYVFQDCTNIDRLVIEDASMSIGAMAFYNCSAMTNVSLGTKLTSIDQSAFRGAGISGTVSIPNTCRFIGDYAFHSCANLTGITIGTNVQTIGTAAFYGCSNVTSLTMNSTALTTVGAEAFISLSKMAGSIAFPSTCTSIGQSAFNGCAALTRVTFAGPTAIANLAFYNCSKITYINLGTGVTSIGQSAFRGTKHSGSLTIPDTCTTIGDYAFQAVTGITSLTIGSGCLSVGQLAFYGCTGITSLSLGSGIQTIGASAFRNLSNATGDISLPSIQTIGNYAFHTASKITSVTYGSSLTQLGDGVFANCTSITSHDFTVATAIPTLTNANCFNNINANCKIWVPSTLYSDWKAATNWSNWEAYIYPIEVDTPGLFNLDTGEMIYSWQQLIDNGDISVVDGVLTGLDSTIAGNLIIATSVTEIAEDGFINFNKLTGVTIPASIEIIGNGAFENCTGLQVINYKTKKISSFEGTGSYRFWNVGAYSATGECHFIFDDSITIIPAGILNMGGTRYGITKITLPANLVTIGASAFDLCAGLTGELVLPETLQEIHTAAFYGTNYTGNLVIPNSVTYIGNLAFGRTTFTNISIGSNVATIQESAFSEAGKNIGSISVSSGNANYYVSGNCLMEQSSKLLLLAGNNPTIPTETVTIGTGSFGRNNSFATITIPGRVTTIKPSAFNESGLTAITIPTNIRTIGNYAFEGSDLTSINIPNTVTSLGDAVFRRCNNLVSATIGTGITTLPYGTFDNCSLLTTISLPNTLTTIETQVIWGCDSLKTLIIPASVRTIHSSAFNNVRCAISYYFTNHTSIPTLGEDAFRSIRSGSKIYVPQSLYTSWKAATNWSTYADYITYEAAETGLFDPSTGAQLYTWQELIDGGYITVEGTTLKSAKQFDDSIQGVLKISDQITAIADYCGTYNYFTTGIEVPDSVLTIGIEAFAANPNLQYVTIGSAVSSIGETAFGTLSIFVRELSSITVSANNPYFKSVDNAVYTKDGTELVLIATAMSTLNVLSGVTTIRSKACYSANITSVTLPSSLTTIEASAFAGCSVLETITFPDNVTEIGASAFFGCVKLFSIYFGSGLTSIGDSAFGSNGVLDSTTTIDFTDATMIPTAGTTIFKNRLKAGSKIYVPSSLYSTWTTATNWSEYASYMEGVKVAGLYNSSGTLVSTWQQLVDAGTITVNSAGYGITACSTSLSGNLVIPISITGIGSYAFKNCTGLTGVTFHDGITNIYTSAFEGCTGLTGTLTLPKGLTAIGQSAFEDCTGLTGTLIIPDGVKTIGNSAFAACSGISGLVLGSSLESINNYAFSGLGLPNGYTITVPSGVTYIGDVAFNTPDANIDYIIDCSAMLDAKATIPTVPYRFASDGSTFYVSYERSFDFITSDWMHLMSNVKYKDANGNIYDEMGGLYDNTTNALIYSWSQLISNGYVTVSGTTVTGSTSALVGKLVIPYSITDIGSSAFSGRTGITYLVFFGKLSTIGSSAFSGCTGLTTIFMDRCRYSSRVNYGSKAFYGCSALTTLNVNSSKYFATDATFEDVYANPMYYAKRMYSYEGTECTSLTYSRQVVTGSENSIVANYAYYNCLSLTEVEIGGNIDIGAYTFAYCSNVLTFNFTGYDDRFTTYPACGIFAFTGINSSAKIIVPDAIATGIKSQTNWSTWASYIVSASSASATAASLSNVSLTVANLDFDSSETALAVVNKEDDLEEEVVNDTTEN